MQIDRPLARAMAQELLQRWQRLCRGRPPGGPVAVRDSKDRSGPVLLFTHDEWKAFLAGAHEGEFELPA